MLNQQEESFNQLVRENQGSIYRICRAYLYDPALADDLYQEILYQVWKSLQNFKGQARVNTWIYRIAVNTAISFNRKNKQNEMVALPNSMQFVYEDTLTPKQEQEAQVDLLRLCISKLEPADRLIISLVLEEKSYKEIAEITGTNINHVGVKINRIKSRLLKLMSIPEHHGI